MNIRTLALLAGLSSAIAPATAAEWQVDPARSSLRFSGVQVGAPFSGRFERFDARISFDPADPGSGRVIVMVDLASARTGDTQRDEALPRKDWFDVAAASQARFEATRFIDKGDGRYEAVGTLTIRGNTKPVTLPFQLSREAGQARAKGHLDLVRSDFGVGQGAWATGQWVGLEVGVDLDIVALAKSGS